MKVFLARSSSCKRQILITHCIKIWQRFWDHTFKQSYKYMKEKEEKSITNFNNKLRLLANEISWNILHILKTLFPNFSPISLKSHWKIILNFQNKEIYHIKKSLNLEIMTYIMRKILNQDHSYTQTILSRCEELDYLKIHSSQSRNSFAAESKMMHFPTLDIENAFKESHRQE